MSDDVSQSFKSISHPIRVKILIMLSKRLNNGYQFSELSRELKIESGGKLSFHLDKMKDLVFVNGEGRYALTEHGHKAVQAVNILEENDDISKDQDNLSKSKVSSQSGNFDGKKIESDTSDVIDSPELRSRSNQSRIYYLIWFISIVLIILTRGNSAYLVLSLSLGILLSFIYYISHFNDIQPKVLSVLTIFIFFSGTILSQGHEPVIIASLIISLLLNLIINLMIALFNRFQSNI